ncbi:MAG: hypothetical protein L0I76_08655 [Pseudonocardia sp.]|nr:hypothetical protein [Pseudonocardia sp.]
MNETLRACHAEWIAWTGLRFTRLALAAGVLTTIAFALVGAGSLAASAANGYDVAASAPAIAAQAVAVGQLPLLVLAATVLPARQAGGALRATVRAVPRRGRLLLATTIVVSGVLGLVGAVAGLAAVVTATVVLGASDGAATADIVRTVLGSGVAVGLTGAVLVGVGALVRATLAALLCGMLLVFVAPLLAEFSASGWVAEAGTYLPSTAAAALGAPDGGRYPALVGALILLVWAVAAQLAGYAALWLRDV